MRTLCLLIALFLPLGGALLAQDPASDSLPPVPSTPVEEPAASPPVTAAEQASQMMTDQQVNFLAILEQGGVIMYPLLGLSFIAVLLIIYYMLTIRQGTVVSDKFMNSADALIRKQDYLGLIAVCNRESEAIARVTYKTLDFATKNPTASFDEVREVTEAEGSRQASILNQRITYLADIGSIAPMVGLLGTVLGMITEFKDLGNTSGVAHMQIGDGVSQALITTASGLVIGIPAMIFYSIFRGKVQKLISELEAAMTHLMALLAAQYKRASYRANTRPGERQNDPSGL